MHVSSASANVLIGVTVCFHIQVEVGKYRRRLCNKIKFWSLLCLCNNYVGDSFYFGLYKNNLRGGTALDLKVDFNCQFWLYAFA